jgi:hypothetical protein
MIEIKLSFNTAEEAILALANMVGPEELARLTGADTPCRAVAPHAPSGTVSPKVEAAPVAAASEDPKPVKVDKPKKAEKSSVTYADVKVAVGKLALIGAGTEGEPGRSAVKGVLAQLGLTTFQGSPEECWPKAIELLTAETVKLQGA